MPSHLADNFSPLMHVFLNKFIVQKNVMIPGCVWQGSSSRENKVLAPLPEALVCCSASYRLQFW